MDFSKELAGPLTDILTKFGLVAFISFMLLALVALVLKFLKIPTRLKNFIITVSYAFILYKVFMEVFL